MKLLGHDIGPERPLFLIAGPDTLESETLAVEVAGRLVEVTRELGMAYIFKGSFDKANRSAASSYRGPGMEVGLKILAAVRAQTGAPVLTDVHTAEQAEPVAAVADVLQTPAFLCRQTDYIEAVATAGRPVNIKKGQFLSPGEVAGVLAKARAAGNEDIMICERGFVFGYNNLVVDMRGLAAMRALGAPVVFDASHSVQLPGGQGSASGGQREHIPVLARAAVAAGVSGLFLETHPEPERALCDGPNALPLAQVPALLRILKTIDEAVKRQPYMEG